MAPQEKHLSSELVAKLEEIPFTVDTWAHLYAALKFHWSAADRSMGVPDTLTIKLVGRAFLQTVKRGDRVVFYRGRPIDILHEAKVKPVNLAPKPTPGTVTVTVKKNPVAPPFPGKGVRINGKQV